jgi:Protein of unknown function (DUF2884)
MKTTLATAALFVCTSTFAHDSSCDADIQGGISIQQNVVEFSQHKKSLYKIVDDQYLFVKGEEVHLDNNQQALVSQYSKEIKAIVPQAKGVALEALDLAVDGVNLAFNELLGSGNDVGHELTMSLNDIRSEINENLSLENGLYVDENGIDGEDLIGEEFEQRIESVMEEAIKNSMGSLMIAVGQEMLFSGGDMEAFETRMEDFGQRIEHEMETKGEALEKSANAICSSLVEIDKLENRMTNEIDVLADFNMLTVDYSGHDKI